jgi:hypothetical protein
MSIGPLTNANANANANCLSHSVAIKQHKKHEK